MQCMEVWGGNRATTQSVAMAGLDAWVHCRPYSGPDQPLSGQSQPTDEGGGDIHYLSSCATGRITRLLIADVSGHGASVSSIAVTLRDLMRRYVNFVDHGRLVRTLNADFVSLADAGCFATALVATYWSPTSRLTLSNAGHPRPLVRRASTGRWEFLHANERNAGADDAPANLPLGLFDPGAYDQFSVTLQPDDLVLLYTDSVIETPDARGRLLGEDGLRSLLDEIQNTDPSALIETLKAALVARQQTDTFNDDLTMVVLRPNELAPRMRMLDGLLAGGRILRAGWERIRRGAGGIPWPELTIANIGGAVISPLGRLVRRQGTSERATARSGV